MLGQHSSLLLVRNAPGFSLSLNAHHVLGGVQVVAADGC